MKFLPDAYTLRARLFPALVVAAPIALAVLSWCFTSRADLATLWTAIAWFGGIAVLAQLGRDAGKRKEKVLFDQWKGKPTTRMLRHRDSTNPKTTQVRHEQLRLLFPDLPLPGTQQENDDPKAADEVYDAMVTELRSRTRDKNKFRLVFEENCNYGFRRNLWGMKAVGIAICCGGVAATLTQFVLGYLKIVTVNTLVAGAASVAIVGMLILWLGVVRLGWVRAPADAYAERLLESLPLLGATKGASRSAGGPLDVKPSGADGAA